MDYKGITEKNKPKIYRIAHFQGSPPFKDTTFFTHIETKSCGTFLVYRNLVEYLHKHGDLTYLDSLQFLGGVIPWLSSGQGLDF